MMLAIISKLSHLGNYMLRKKLEKAFFLILVVGFFDRIEYIGIECNTKKKEVEMRSIQEQLERVKNLLEANLEEMKKMQEAELAMRELCSYELQTIKK